MKHYLKKLLTKTNIFLIVVVIFACIVRLYNFSDRVTFWSEQARSLIVSADYIFEKPSLLGQEYFRQDSFGHKIYSGAIFNYSLVPLILFTKDPIFITIFFVILNIITGIVVFFVFKKIFNEKMALISSIVFLFNDYMIYHSLFIWNYNWLPLIGVFGFYFIWLYIKNKSKLHLFLLGFLSGVGISLQFLFAPIALILFAVCFFKSKNKLLVFIIFSSGILLGNLPMILFDLRHNFYNLQTLFNFFLDTLKGKSDAGFSYYYLLPLWPFFALLLSFVINWFLKTNKILGVTFVLLYIYLNLISPLASFIRAYGMHPGLTTKDIDYASKVIADDVNGRFNVSEVLDFDKRGYVFRYFLKYKYFKEPLDETQYQNPGVLYVFANKDFEFEKTDIWEINASGTHKVELLSPVAETYGVYKLTPLSDKLK